MDINPSGRKIRAYVSVEIDASFFPPSLYGTLGQFLQGCNLGEGKSAEEFQIHQFSEFRLDFRQLIEGVADHGKLFPVGGTRDIVIFEGHDFETATPLDRAAVPRMIDDKSTHHPRGVSHEACLVGK